MWDFQLHSFKIISVDPNTPYNLKGLGILIDRVEIEKLLLKQSKDDIIYGFLNNDNVRPGIRPGFHRNDPWYDGRGFQNYTIIDAPRAGTALTVAELENLMLNIPLWNLYCEALENKGLNNFTLDDLCALASPVFEVIKNP